MDKRAKITLAILICMSVCLFLLDQSRNHLISKDIKVENDTLPKDINAALQNSVSIPIITYHYVEVVKDPKDTFRKSLSITPSTFEAHIIKLRKMGYEPVFVNEIPGIINGTEKPEKKPISLTFDDGYKDFYTDVLPIIKKEKVKTTIYVVTSFIGKNDNYMNKSEIQDALQTGLVELGSHTIHHFSLGSANITSATNEIVNSKSILENMFMRKVVSFAYPFGYFTKNDEQILKDAGYTSAVSEIYGYQQNNKNIYSLSRIRSGFFYRFFK